MALPLNWQMQSVEDNDGNMQQFMFDPVTGQRVAMKNGMAQWGEDGMPDFGPAYNLLNPSGDRTQIYGSQLQAGDQISFDDLMKMGIVGGSPDPKKDVNQFMQANGLTPQQYQAQYGGLPFDFGNGTATYNPDALKNRFDYVGEKSWQEVVFPAAIMALTGAGMAGMLPGTTSAFSGLGAGAGAGGFSSSIPLAEGMSAFAAPGTAGGSSLGGLANFSLATPGAGIGGVGSAGLGIGSGAGGGLIGSTAANLAAAGGVGSLGALPSLGGAVGSGLGLQAVNAAGNALSGAAMGTSAAPAAMNKSALGSLLKNTLGLDVNDSTLDLIGKGLATGLGVYGANQQADATKDLYGNFMNLGAPYRAELANLNANPQSFYSSPMVQGALQQGSDSMARSLSAKVGNPILNPTAMQEMQNYTTKGLLDAYNQRWNQLSSAGQLGVGQSASLGSQAAGAQAGTYNALGAGLGSVFGNQRDYAGELMDLMRTNRSSSGLSLA